MSRRSLNRYQLKHPFLGRVERWLHFGMDAVLGNSKAVVQELQAEGVKKERSGLIYNGTDLSAFENLPPRSTVRQSLGISEHATLLVCVANLIPYKGHADLIKALGMVHSELPSDWAIAMVGRDTGIGASLRVLAGDLGVEKHILWLGERSDAIFISSAAEIGVLCSHEEGFSNSVLEGMAAGVAMIVTDVGGNAEAVVSGESGIVVPARDYQALGQAILALVKDEGMKVRMAKAAQRRVKEKFSLDACVAQYAALYNGLLNNPGIPVSAMLNSVQGKAS
jgi:glycosyltransferase involved in cell wall biosynthesis